jgi:putative DNA primase/helicase
MGAAMIDVRTIANALGGDVLGRDTVLAPGPGHSRKDRSLAIKLDSAAPDGFLIYSHAGDDWKACREHVRTRLGLPPWEPGDEQNRTIPPSRVQQWDLAAIKAEVDEGPRQWSEDELARIASARRIWDAGKDPRGTLAEIYLRQHRRLDLPDALCGAVLRFHPYCPWRNEDTGKTEHIPALITAFRSVDHDAVTGIQRIRLNSDGSLYGRRMRGIVHRAAIKFGPASKQLCIGEGTETCLAGRQLGFMPAWALGSVGAITFFPLIDGVQQLTIFGEAGNASADAIKIAGTRWRRGGRRVRVVMPIAGSDLNDVISEQVSSS